MAGRISNGFGKAAGAAGKAVGYAGAASAGIEAAQKLWETANKDGKVTEAANAARDRAAALAESRSPLAKLERALDAADRSIEEFEPADDQAREARQRWVREAATLRSKTTPLRGLPAGRQKKVAADLRRRATALLDEIVAYGLEPRRTRRRGGGVARV